MIQGMLECLGMSLFSGCCGTGCGVLAQGLLRLEGAPATLSVDFLGAWVPLVPVTSGAVADTVSSSPLIL